MNQIVVMLFYFALGAIGALIVSLGWRWLLAALYYITAFLTYVLVWIVTVPIRLLIWLGLKP